MGNEEIESNIPERVKVTFLIPQGEVLEWKELVASLGITMTETLRRGIAMMGFVDDEIEKGNTFLIQERPVLFGRVLGYDGDIRKLIIR